MVEAKLGLCKLLNWFNIYSDVILSSGFWLHKYPHGILIRYPNGILTKHIICLGNLIIKLSSSLEFNIFIYDLEIDIKFDL